MTFDPSSKTFKVYEETNLNYADTYNIVVTGTLSIGSASDTLNFDIVV